MARRLLSLFSMLTLAFALAAQGLQPENITIEKNVAVKMRDGVTLRADIYRPKADGKYPTLLQRTPYNKEGGVEFGKKAADEGYVTIVQDVRGRYSSEGDWYPFLNESNDGYDTVEWAATLPYSTARWGCGAGRTWALHRCSLPLRIRRIWQASAPW